jgi:hypothetical protein
MTPEFTRVRALIFEPYTLFRVRPMMGQFVNVAEPGYRLTGQDVVWPPDTAIVNVFVFGGSTAFGYGVADAETIPAKLGEQISDMLSNKRVSVYNFATPNFTSVQERIQLEQLLLEGHRPHVAIFIDGFDEFVAPYYAPLMLKRFTDATAFQSSWRQCAKLFQTNLGAAYRRLKSGASDDESQCKLPDPGVVLDKYIRNVRLVTAVCREFDVHPVFVWQPVPCYRYDGEGLHSAGHGSSARLIDCVRSGYALMDARRSEEFFGKPFLWLGDMQRGRTSNLYVDPDHYTPEFSREIALVIAQHLIKNSLIE